jgi:NADH-quinone oxidoreductase subunit N
MNYGQFLNMIPEALLVLALLIVFFADFCLHKSERKVSVLGKLTAALLLCQTVMLTVAEPSIAFGGMYVATQAANVMKLILTMGTLIVVIMAQPWVENEARRYAGEFHLLVLSTLLGMYMMTSSGNFLMFFLGLETASVPWPVW